MEGPRDDHTKLETEGYTPYDITYVWNLKYNTNEHIFEKKQTCGCQGKESEGGKDGEFGTSRCKLLYIGWINNKVLLG